MMTHALLTDTEAADLLKLTPRQVTRLANRGELPSVRLPGPGNRIRFVADDLAQWVESRKRPVPQGGDQ